MNYDRFLNPAVAAVPPSGIRRFFDLASTMKDAISLGVGEPDFKTPYPIRNVSINSLVDGVVASRCIAAEMVGVVGLYYSLLRIKDNGIPFNPEERAALVREDSPYKNIGTRIVHGLASQVSYQNLMGLNVLTIEVGRHA